MLPKIKILISLVYLIGSLCFAQWQGDFRLTNNPSISSTSFYNSSNCVASNGNLVHVVWWDSRNSDPEIYYKRSTDGGVTWGTDTRLTNSSGDSYNPSIALSGQTVYVVWYDGRHLPTPYEIYFKSSTDGGTTWGPDTRLTNDSYNSGNPVLSVSGSVLHLMWFNQLPSTNDEIYYKRSTDGGITWSADMRLTNAPNYSENPSIAVSGSVVHAVWYDNRDPFFEIYYKRSTDAGLTWGPDIALTQSDFMNSECPSVSVLDSTVHIVWIDTKNGGTDVYYIKSTNAGTGWGPETRLTTDPSNSFKPSTALSGGALHIAWFDNRDGNYEIYYKRTTDGGTTWGADTRLTNNSGASELCFISVSGTAAHVVWRDDRDGNSEIYYKRDPSANPNAVNIISTEIPKGFSLSQNYPNPFNPVTMIDFSIPKSSFVKMKVYDALGNEIALLVDQNLIAGNYKVDFDAGNFSCGIYFYVITAGEFTQTKKMILVK